MVCRIIDSEVLPLRVPSHGSTLTAVPLIYKISLRRSFYFSDGGYVQIKSMTSPELVTAGAVSSCAKDATLLDRRHDQQCHLPLVSIDPVFCTPGA